MFKEKFGGHVRLCPRDLDSDLAGGADWSGAVCFLVGHLPARHPEPDLQGAAPKQAHHGGQHAFASGIFGTTGFWIFGRDIEKAPTQERKE